MKCNRCKKETFSTIMSKLNTQMICPDCEEAEKKPPRYQEAVAAELEACQRGDFNFPGIGL